MAIHPCMVLGCNFKNEKMKKTSIEFTLIKIGKNDFLVDPTSIFIAGWFNWNMLHDFLFEKKDTCLPDIGIGMIDNEYKTNHA